MNNTKEQIIKPLIFSKKIKENYNTIPLNIPNNTLGPNRHFPVATKEWYNSIYTYNNNNLKNLNIADKSLARLIESYFNFYFSKKILEHKRIPIRFRRSSFNKIFLSKTELKHTNSKVIINLNVFNQQKISLTRDINRLFNRVFSLSYLTKKRYSDKKYTNIWTKLKVYNKAFNFSLGNYLAKLSNRLNDNITEQYNLKSVKRNKEKQVEIEKLNLFINEINNILPMLNSLSNVDNNKLFAKLLRKTLLEDEIENISRYKLLLDLNRSKFEYNFIFKLKEIIGKIYNKEIELNIINLNSLYLDMSIFTNAIARKLKDRDNNVLKTFKRSLLMVKVPYINPIKEKYGKSPTNQTWLNKVQALRLNSLIVNYKNNKDNLDKILLNTIPNSIKAESNNFYDETNKKLLEVVYKSIKYRNLRGVRLEAKGRLTRRFTAARAIFKVKWKGGLKNIDSSYRGLSSTILRGNLKSNVQYYAAVNRNRIGAYGVKGWIAGR